MERERKADNVKIVKDNKDRIDKLKEKKVYVCVWGGDGV